MAGTCPETATDDCIPGFSWTPNGASAYTQRPFPYVDVDTLYRPPFLSASCGMATNTLSIEEGTEVSTFDNRWLIRYGTTGRSATQ
jgi:hypothetical protein